MWYKIKFKKNGEDWRGREGGGQRERDWSCMLKKKKKAANLGIALSLYGENGKRSKRKNEKQQLIKNGNKAKILNFLSCRVLERTSVRILVSD